MRERLEMPVSDRLVTAEEFERMPEEPGVRMELVRGRVVRMSPANLRHGLVAGRVYEILLEHVVRTGTGRILPPTGFKIATHPDTVREPDIAFVGSERLRAAGLDTFFQGPPDLAVEVVSHRDRLPAIHRKATDYIDHGVPVVWVVHPRLRTLTVYTPSTEPLILREGDVLEGGGVLPGFRCEVRRIFQ